jgi:hypothetical protein
VIQWPQRTRATADQTRVGSRYIRIGSLRINILLGIMAECQTWSEQCRPIFMPEDSPDLGNWSDLAQHATELMATAKPIAVAGYRQGLEDGPDVCDSESDSENSDHGEMWSYADMYTPDMLGGDGKPKTGGPQQLPAAQVLAMRAAARRAPSQPKGSAESTTQASTRLPTPLNSDDEDSDTTEDQKRRLASDRRKSGREGGLATVGMTGKKDTSVASGHPSHTCPR